MVTYMYTIHKKWEAISYRPKFSCFDDIQLFQNKLFAFTKNDHMWRACVTIIFANKIFTVRQFS